MNKISSIENMLDELGFSKPQNVQGRASIADIFRKNRCGIYVLHFADEAYYVGKAVNVVRRYAQHRHTHSDIHQISFKRVSLKNLDSEERHVVKHLEDRAIRLRNIQIVSFSYGETDFDLIMSRTDQEQWLNDLAIRGLAGERVVDNSLRTRYTRKFEQFQKMPFAAEVTEVFRAYAQSSIPAIKCGEIAFWMCSCMLKQEAEAFFYSRINVGFQTTLQAYTYANKLYFGWFITRNLAGSAIRHLNQPFRRFLVQSTEYLFRGTPFLNINDAGLIQGGPDQIYVEAEGVPGAMSLIENPAMALSFRKFNLGLVQKGPCPWGRFHCLDLADKLII